MHHHILNPFQHNIEKLHRGCSALPILLYNRVIKITQRLLCFACSALQSSLYSVGSSESALLCLLYRVLLYALLCSALHNPVSTLYSVLLYRVLLYGLLCYALQSFTLRYTLFCSTLYSVLVYALLCSVLQSSSLRSTLFCSTEFCSTLYFVMLYRVLLYALLCSAI